MFKRHQLPDENGDSNSSESAQEPGDHQAEAGTSPDDKNARGDNGQADLEDAESSMADAGARGTLLFPFLKDHGLECASVCRYFCLSLGASMSREGDEGHAKTIQRLYPEWFDPRSSKQQREAHQASTVVATPTSKRFSLSSCQETSVTALAPPTASPHQTSVANQSKDEQGTLKPKVSSSASDLCMDDPLYLIEREKKLQISGLDDATISENLEDAVKRDPCETESVSSEWLSKTCPDSDPSRFSTLSPIFKFSSTSRTRKTGVSREEQLTSLFDTDEKHDIDTEGKVSDANMSLTLCTNSIDSHSASQSPILTGRSTVFRRSNTINNGLMASAPGKNYALNGQRFREESLDPVRTKDMALPVPSWRKISPALSSIPACPSAVSSPRHRKWSSTSSLERRNSAIERLFSSSELSDMTSPPLFDSSGAMRPRRRRFSKKLSSSSVTQKLSTVDISAPQALSRFRSVVRTVRIITGVCLALKSYVKQAVTTDWTFVEMYLHLQKDITPSLAFDLHSFSKTEPPKGGRRLERLLSIPPERRTPVDIQNILAFVRTHETFQQFPSHLQVKLCMVMYYQSYEPRRIILREGHPPSAFYLVLSGSLIANVSETSPTTGKTFIRTVADVREGECFGEIALLERTTRTASIVCKTRSELLVIYKEDFDQLILEPLLQQKKSDVNCCVKHSLFEEFDEAILYSNPQEFFYQYFPKNTLIVKDSHTCPFLILVKSGSCKLIGSYRRSDPDWEGNKDFSRDVADTFPLYTQMRRMGLAKDPWEKPVDPDADSTIYQALEEGMLMGSIDKHTLRKALDASARPSTTSRERTSEQEQRQRRQLRHRSSTLSAVFDQLEEDRRQLQRSLGAGWNTRASDYWSKRMAGSYKETARTRRHHGRRQSQMWKLLQRDEQSYAEIASLAEGCVFGLETMVSVPGPSVMLVSKGAECLMVSKRLFLQHANIRSLRVAGDMVMSFPTAEALESTVKENRKWKRYKSQLVQGVLHHGITT